MVASDCGILASYDLVALDKATADLVNRHNQGSYFSESKKVYEKMFSYASQKGLGNLEYDLIEL